MATRRLTCRGGPTHLTVRVANWPVARSWTCVGQPPSRCWVLRPGAELPRSRSWVAKRGPRHAPHGRPNRAIGGTGSSGIDSSVEIGNNGVTLAGLFQGRGHLKGIKAARASRRRSAVRLNRDKPESEMRWDGWAGRGALPLRAAIYVRRPSQIDEMLRFCTCPGKYFGPHRWCRGVCG